MASTSFPNIIRIMSGACGAMSIAGSLCLIVSFLAFSRNQWKSATASSSVDDKVRALLGGYLLTVAFLAVADTFVGTSWLLSLFLPEDSEGSDTLCKLQAWLLAVAPLMSACWTVCLGFELLSFTVNIHKEITGSFIRRRYYFYHISWIVPVLLAGPLAAGPSVPVFNGGMCWLDDGPTGIQPFLWLYVPKLVVMVFLVGVYVTVALRRCQLDADEPPTHRAKNRPCCPRTSLRTVSFHLYPAIYLITTLFPLLMRLNIGLEHPNPSDPDYSRVSPGFLAIAVAILGPAQGFLNCVVFVLGTTSVRRQVLKLFAFVCCSSRHSSRLRTATREDLGESGSNSQVELQNGVVSSVPLIRQPGDEEGHEEEEEEEEEGYFVMGIEDGQDTGYDQFLPLDSSEDMLHSSGVITVGDPTSTSSRAQETLDARAFLRSYGLPVAGSRAFRSARNLRASPSRFAPSTNTDLPMARAASDGLPTMDLEAARRDHAATVAAMMTEDEGTEAAPAMAAEQAQVMRGPRSLSTSVLPQGGAQLRQLPALPTTVEEGQEPAAPSYGLHFDDDGSNLFAVVVSEQSVPSEPLRRESDMSDWTHETD
jgi:hypothetical protein